MRNQYTTINFNGETFTDIFNATLENEFYSDVLIGSRSIVEEKIPGRDLPYFYWIEHEPLSFEVTFAFSKPLLMSQIKEIVRKFLRPKTYADFRMADDSGNFTPLFKVIFVDEPTLEHFYKPFPNGADGYVGYFKLIARCNAPYGYQTNVVTLNSTSNPVVVADSLGDLDSTDYTITIENPTGADFNNFALFIKYDPNDNTGSFNEANGDEKIEFSKVYAGELITIKGRLKRISSVVIAEEDVPLYERWNKAFPTIAVGYNKFFSTHSAATVIINYEIPRLI